MMTPFWPWLVAGAVILLAIMIAIAGAAIVDAVERRRATAALARAAAARHHLGGSVAVSGPTIRRARTFVFVVGGGDEQAILRA